MIAVLQTLTIAAAAGAVLLVLVAPWRGTWANVTALALSGLAAISAAMQVDEGQIALAWLAARVVTITLHMTASPVAHAREPSTGPFRRLQLGLRSSVAAATPERLSERVFRVAVAAVWLGIAAVVALRAFESGVVLDPIQAWAALALLGGGVAASVLTPDVDRRFIALQLALSGLAIGLVWLDRDWGRALAIAVMDVVVAIQAVAEPGEKAEV